MLLLLLSCADPTPSDTDRDTEEDTADSRDTPDPGSLCPAVDAPLTAVAGTCLPFDGPLEMTKVWTHPADAGSMGSKSGATVGPLWDSNMDGRITAADQPYVVLGGFRLYALDGRDGSIFWFTDRVLGNFGAPLLVNLDGLGNVEVVGYNGTETPVSDTVWFFDGASGERMHRGSAFGQVPGGSDSLSAADVDGDGDAEILEGRSIVGPDGNVVASGLHAEGSPPNSSGSMLRESYGVDLDGDGVAEVLAGPSAYYGDGTTMWNNPLLPDSHSFVADFDGDLEPDVLLVSSPWMWGLDATNGEVEWGPIALEGSCDDNVFSAGAAAIEDLDGDGLPEFVIPCSTRLAAYTWGGHVLWSIAVPGYGSVAIADLDGDGVPEVAFQGQYEISIVAGPNGNVRWRSGTSGGGNVATPVFADLDLDGTLEMVTTTSDGNPESDKAEAEAIAWRANPAGPGRRTIWNSHSYHISDVNDNMTVPTVSEPYWLTTNSFRSAGLGERAPDIALTPQFVDLCDLECAWGRVVFTATLANAGGEAAPAGLEVVLTAGPGGAVLATATTSEEVPPYATGEALRFEITLEDLNGQPPTLEVDPNATRLQCLTWPEDDVVSWPGGVCG